MIEKEILSEIIIDYQKNTLPPLVERELQNHIDLEIPLNRAIAILGPRRSGKTFFLYYLKKSSFRKKLKKREPYTLILRIQN
jgi:predicted AAA+ superfamily ATPase